MIERPMFPVGNVRDLDGKNSLVVEAGGERILVRKVGDEWQAYSLRCPHKGAAMREIDLRDNVLACPLHGWLFDLDDNGRELHDYADLPRYTIHVENGSLLISF